MSSLTAVAHQEEAIKPALGALDVEVLGIRQDELDTPWDVFVKKATKLMKWRLMP